jgi:hypothetical protein
MRLVVVFLLVSAVLGRSEDNPSGRWEGSVQIPGRELRLIVDLAQGDGGNWVGSIIIPGLGVKGIPLAEITVKSSDVSLAVKSGREFQARLKAQLNPGGTLSGDFVQAGNTAPFVLKKIGPAQVEFPRHSTAVANDVEGEWKGEYELFGYPRHVTLKLANRGGDGAIAEFVIVGKKTNNLPVDFVSQDGELVTIDSHETGITYEGRRRKEAEEINGILIQGPLEIPLVLRRAK